MEKPSLIDHLLSLLVLPFMAMVVIPWIVYQLTTDFSLSFLPRWTTGQLQLIGGVLAAVGIPLFIQSVALFVRVGEGTLAPWNPTQHLIVVGPYRYMRHPMILGVFCVILAEAFFFSSVLIFLWACIFLVGNHLYFIFSEEPNLEKRFGKEYLDYEKNVPRWLPRLTAWRPEGG